jgi:hypothetical protein
LTFGAEFGAFPPGLAALAGHGANVKSFKVILISPNSTSPKATMSTHTHHKATFTVPPLNFQNTEMLFVSYLSLILKNIHPNQTAPKRFVNSVTPPEELSRKFWFSSHFNQLWNLIKEGIPSSRVPSAAMSMTKAEFICVMKWWDMDTPQPESKSIGDQH